MDKKDFEYLLTKRAWEDKEFAELLSREPHEALSQLGVSVSGEVTVKVILQDRGTLYFIIPAFDENRCTEEPFQLNQVDIWSSGQMFLWLASAEQKAKLLQIRNSIVTAGTTHE